MDEYRPTEGTQAATGPDGAKDVAVVRTAARAETVEPRTLIVILQLVVGVLTIVCTKEFLFGLFLWRADAFDAADLMLLSNNLLLLRCMDSPTN